MSRNDVDHGGSAFPCEGGVDSGLYPDAGMSLRDYFAGQVIAVVPARSWDHLPDDTARINAWAKCAYTVADAMLAARSAK
ncbi:hypothetical protein D3Y55_21325 [Mesorhizobium sp. DCY119]|nr:hypothetical protein D3Y55_21325 [Mesorhizobium sp. DCY119]